MKLFHAFWKGSKKGHFGQWNELVILVLLEKENSTFYSVLLTCYSPVWWAATESTESSSPLELRCTCSVTSFCCWRNVDESLPDQTLQRKSNNSVLKSWTLSRMTKRIDEQNINQWSHQNFHETWCRLPEHKK